MRRRDPPGADVLAHILVLVALSAPVPLKPDVTHASQQTAGASQQTAVASGFSRTETVAEIRVHGNVLTPDAEIRRLAGIDVGAIFTPDTAAEVTRRLETTHRFESVEVLKRYASIADPTQVLLVVIVDEGRGEDRSLRGCRSAPARRSRERTGADVSPAARFRGRLRVHLRGTVRPSRSRRRAQPAVVSAHVGRRQTRGRPAREDLRCRPGSVRHARPADARRNGRVDRPADQPVFRDRRHTQPRVVPGRANHRPLDHSRRYGGVAGRVVWRVHRSVRPVRPRHRLRHAARSDAGTQRRVRPRVGRAPRLRN